MKRERKTKEEKLAEAIAKEMWKPVNDAVSGFLVVFIAFIIGFGLTMLIGFKWFLVLLILFIIFWVWAVSGAKNKK